jgi:hypothetical protein
MSDDNRRVRVRYVRCPNEVDFNAHWILSDWDTKYPPGECRWGAGARPVRVTEPLKRGLVSLQESDQGWSETEPDPYDDVRYHKLNDLPIKEVSGL